MRIWPAVRGALLLVLVASGVALWVMAERASAEPDAAARARPVSMPVDISKAGMYVAPFEQTYSGSHYQSLVLEIEPNPPGDWSPERGLKGLKGQMRILDSAGATVVEQGISQDVDIQGTGGPGCIHLTEFYPPPKGSYKFEIDVTSPAEAMPPGHQVMTLRYRLCGLEYFPSQLCRLGAWAMFVIAFLIALIAGARWFSRRRGRSAVEQQAPGEALPPPPRNG
jgi:hypothetical protein